MIKSIKGKNFGLFKELDIEFPNYASIINIYCEYNDNKNMSNRGGKSTLIDAISYNRNGICSKPDKENLIHRDAKEDMYTNCEWERDGKSLNILRGKYLKGKTKNFISVDGKEGHNQQDIQKEIDKFFGMNPKENLLTSFINQDDINMYMNLEKIDKRKWLLSWLDNTNWEEKEKICSENVQKYNRGINEILDEMSHCEQNIVDFESLKNELKELNKKIKNIENEINKKTKTIEDYNTSLENINEKDKINKKINDYTNEINEVTKKIKELGNLEKEKREIEIELGKYTDNDSKINDLKEKQDEINSELTTVKASLYAINKQINEINKFGGVCPVTSKPCKEINKEKLLEEYSNKKGIKEKIVNDYNLDIDKIKKQILSLEKISKKINELKIKKARIEQAIELREEFNIKKNKLNKELEEYKEKRKEIKNLNKEEILNDIRENKKQLNELRLQYRNFNEKVGNLKLKLINHKKAKQKIEELKVKKNDLDDEIGAWIYVKHLCSKSGIPSDILNEEKIKLENDINYVLSQINESLTLEFQLKREIQKWESHCLKCGSEFKSNHIKECKSCGEKREKQKTDDFQLKIFENGKEISFDDDSGGGKCIISLAMRIGLSRLKARQNNNEHPDTLFCDEILAPLDTINKQLIIDTFENVLIKKLGYKQIFIISHCDVKDRFENNIKIKRYKYPEEYSVANWD